MTKDLSPIGVHSLRDGSRRVFTLCASIYTEPKSPLHLMHRRCTQFTLIWTDSNALKSIIVFVMRAYGHCIHSACTRYTKCPMLGRPSALEIQCKSQKPLKVTKNRVIEASKQKAEAKKAHKMPTEITSHWERESVHLVGAHR